MADRITDKHSSESNSAHSSAAAHESETAQETVARWSWNLRSWKATKWRELRIHDFFNDSDKLHTTQLRWFSPLIVLTFTLGGIYACLLWRGTPPFSFLPNFGGPNNPKATAATFILNALISISASLLAVFLVNRANTLRMDVIRHLARTDLLESVLNVIGAYRQRYAEDKHYHLKFDRLRQAPDGFTAIECTLYVRERIRPNRRHLVVDFRKLRRSEGESNELEAGLTTSLVDPLVPDELHSVDVTEIEKHFAKEDLPFRGVTEITINSDPRVFDGACVEDRKARKQSSVDNRERWVVDLMRDDFKKDEIVDVECKYLFFLETTGYFFFEASEPTRGFNCSIDYSSLIGQMNCYVIESIHATEHTHDVKKHRSGVITVSTDEWILPRGNVSFLWYKTDPSSKESAQKTSGTRPAEVAPSIDASKNTSSAKGTA